MPALRAFLATASQGIFGRISVKYLVVKITSFFFRFTISMVLRGNILMYTIMGFFSELERTRVEGNNSDCGQSAIRGKAKLF